MDPKLIAIAGPLEGTTITIAGEETIIGREPPNLIYGGDPMISRRHCVVLRDGERFKIVDRESSNGVFVNGAPVTERHLDHGDMILVGGTHFLFHHPSAPEDASATGVLFDEATLSPHSTIRLRREEAHYLQPEALVASGAPAATVARDLATLLRIGTAIGAAKDLDGLKRQVLESVLESVPADRGTILLVADGATPHGRDAIESTFSLARSGGEALPVRVSATVVDEVLREGVGLLSNDLASAGLATAASLVSSGATSLLAVPLPLFENPIGVIYLESRDPAIVFEESHLQLLTAVAAMAAAALEKARRTSRLESEARRLRAEINMEHDLVGRSDRMRAVHRFIDRAAPSVSTVLITGESGTGKELVARAIHRASPRAEEPFVAVNCAVLTDTLLESELFGHERGAFTGAVAQKRGRLELADGGTIFLDEIGDLPLGLQAKLLRVLQEREFERVGGTRTIRVDIRVLAATNRDLKQAIADGSFREDLYYRLNVVSLPMPPLRERCEDIELLANHFMAKYSARCKRRVTAISAQARACLESYDWPGNVRELENAVERAVVMGSSEVILPEDFPETLLETGTQAGAPAGDYHAAVQAAKRQIIITAMERAGGNFTVAAQALGLHPNNLHRLVRSLDLKASLKK